jgi:hypothetical protein
MSGGSVASLASTARADFFGTEVKDVSMSLPRRIAPLAWAERHDAAIVEHPGGSAPAEERLRRPVILTAANSWSVANADAET